MDDSAVICDKIIETYDKEIKTIPTNFNEKKHSVESKKDYYHFTSKITN